MINRLKDSKVLYIVLSIVIAVVLWMYVMDVESPDMQFTISDIPVTFVGENVLAEENLMVISGKDATISLDLQAKRQIQTQLDRTNITITVDLSRLATVGEHQLAYDIRFPSNITVGGNLTILNRSSNYVNVTLGRMVTKTIEVEGIFEGSVADGYVAEEMIFSPETIEISGEELEIAKVRCAQVTVVGQDLTETLSMDLPFTLIGYEGEEIASQDIQMSQETVNVTLPVVVVKDVPLQVELTEGGGAKAENARVEITPSTITVSGREEIVSNVESITIGTVDLSQVIGSGELTFTIPIPTGLSNVSGVSEARVTVSIEGLSTRNIDVTNLTTINEPDNVNVTFVTESLQVVVRGPEEILAQISPHNLRAVADLSNVGTATGRYTVPVEVYLDGYADAGVVGEYQAVVSLTR